MWIARWPLLTSRRSPRERTKAFTSLSTQPGQYGFSRLDFVLSFLGLRERLIELHEAIADGMRQLARVPQDGAGVAQALLAKLSRFGTLSLLASATFVGLGKEQCHGDGALTR